MTPFLNSAGTDLRVPGSENGTRSSESSNVKNTSEFTGFQNEKEKLKAESFKELSL